MINNRSSVSAKQRETLSLLIETSNGGHNNAFWLDREYRESEQFCGLAPRLSGRSPVSSSTLRALERRGFIRKEIKRNGVARYAVTPAGRKAVTGE